MDGMHCIGKIKVKSDKGTLDLDVTNTVTQLFEEIVAHEGIDGIFANASPIEGGQTWILSNAGAITQKYVQYRDNADSGFQITVYLLNLQDSEKNGLNSKSNVLPVYTSALNAIDDSKIVGYATVKVAATKTKEGYLIPLEGETLVSHRRHGLQWKWEPGVLSGSFNAICVGVNVLNDRNIYNGITLMRSVENNNKLLGENNENGYFMIPGVKSEDGGTVWTEDNEILLGGVKINDYNKSRFVFNLETGERKSINSDDVRYDLTLQRPIDYLQAHIGDYYICYNSGTKDIKTKESKTSIVQGNYYDSVFELDGYIYSAYSFSTYTHEMTLYAYNKETLSRESEHDKTITIPSTFERPRIFKYNENYLLTDSYYYFDSISDNKGSIYDKGKSIVFSNLDDIENSIIEIIPAVQALNFAFINNKPYFFTSDYSNRSQNTHTDASIGVYYYNDPSSYSQQVYKNGLKYTTEGMYGNLFSFKTFDSQQQIPEGEGVKLQYYYTFEQ